MHGNQCMISWSPWLQDSQEGNQCMISWSLWLQDSQFHECYNNEGKPMHDKLEPLASGQLKIKKFCNKSRQPTTSLLLSCSGWNQAGIEGFWHWLLLVFSCFAMPWARFCFATAGEHARPLFLFYYFQTRVIHTLCIFLLLLF